MIKFNLDTHMNEKGLSIQEVADLTGLSRNTISQLYNNSGKGIQFETLNRLVTALNIDIFELFEIKLLVSEFKYSIEHKKNDDLQLEHFLNFLDDKNEIAATLNISSPQMDESEKFHKKELHFYIEHIESSSNIWLINDYLSNFDPFSIELTFSKIAKEIIDYIQIPSSTTYDIIFQANEISSHNISFLWTSEWLNNIDYFHDLLKKKYSLQYMDLFNTNEFGDLNFKK